ncbi:MAG TPA: acyl-CoA carboxylase subunit beta [Anaerolineae bacterium]|nr:acyl-CoA carboxylase subunit beta [Anaerolineae bacterium]HPL27843.1 acyl-CoA carboxylase subunit beta [Anaerolineae bacterium]
MDMREKLEELAQRRAGLTQGGGQRAVDRQHQRGKLTARERIAAFLDPGSFVELGLWATPRPTGFDIDAQELPGDGVIAGYGAVDGRPVCIYAQDFTVAGGSLGSTGAKKIIKVMRRALDARMPCIGLVDSGGVRVQDSVTRSMFDGYPSMFYYHTLSSGVIPQITLMMGPCAAGAAYSPALTDFVIMVKNTSYMYVASPTLVKAAQFVDTDDQALGGASVHATISGCCDLVAEDDGDCLLRARELLSFLPLSNTEPAPVYASDDDPSRGDEALLDIVPADSRKPYDMHDIIAHVVDNGYFFELKPDYAPNMITGFGRLDGHSVGFVANNPQALAGTIDINASDKEARFIRFCDAFNIPLVFLVDTPAYLPGVDQEHGGILRHGAKVLHAIAEATVPMVTVYVRKAYGGGNHAMCSEPLGSDLLLAWPTAELGLMSPEGAVAIIYRKEIAAAPNPDELRAERIEQFKATFGKFPYHAAAMQWVEEIIDPRDTRPMLINALRMLAKKQKSDRPWKKHGNIPL